MPSRRLSSFTLVDNETWAQDELVLPSVRLRQEATDWSRAAEIGLGAVVWDAALAFCGLVESCGEAGAEFWRGKSVLELGAGCGAAGLTLAAKGAEVVLTDREAVLPLLERNVALNTDFPASVRFLEWEDAGADEALEDGRWAGRLQD